MNGLKKMLAGFLAAALLILPGISPQGATAAGFTDVPAGAW